MTDGYEAIYGRCSARRGVLGRRGVRGRFGVSGSVGAGSAADGGDERGGEPRPLKPVMSDASDLAASGRAS